MNQVHKTEEHHSKTKSQAPDSLDRVRQAAQALHGAISDAATKSEEKAKHEMKGLSHKAKAIADSLEESLAGQSEAIKKHLVEAKTFVESTEKHVAAGLKSTGREAETSFRQALRNAHAAAEKITEAVATKRMAESTHRKS